MFIDIYCVACSIVPREIDASLFRFSGVSVLLFLKLSMLVHLDLDNWKLKDIQLRYLLIMLTLYNNRAKYLYIAIVSIMLCV